MFKKIALVAAIATTASFATYSYFPVGDANKGEATIGPGYYWTKDWSTMQISANAKYNVIQNLEVSLQGLGYQLWDEADICDEDGVECDDSNGLLALTIGARYQFMPMLIAALDVKLPKMQLANMTRSVSMEPFSSPRNSSPTFSLALNSALPSTLKTKMFLTVWC